MCSVYSSKILIKEYFNSPDEIDHQQNSDPNVTQNIFIPKYIYMSGESKLNKNGKLRREREGGG